MFTYISNLWLKSLRLTELRKETFHRCQRVGGRCYFILSLFWRTYVKNKLLIFKLTEYSNVDSSVLLLHFSFSLVTTSISLQEPISFNHRSAWWFYSVSSLCTCNRLSCFSLPHMPRESPSDLALGRDSGAQPRTEGLLLGGEDM